MIIQFEDGHVKFLHFLHGYIMSYVEWAMGSVQVVVGVLTTAA